MSLDAKRRAAAIGLLLFAAWPLLHRGLVAYADVSPWRFFGWAMYCQPKLPVEVEVYVQRRGTALPLEKAAVVRPELRMRQLEFAQRREIWGAFLPPDDVAVGALEAVPDADGVEVVIRRLRLDPATSHIGVRVQTYRYTRHPQWGMAPVAP